MRRVILFTFLRRAVWGGGGGGRDAARLFLLFSFPCSADHERDWPPCVCVCVFFLFILDIKFVGRTSRGHTGGRSHRISHPPSKVVFFGLATNTLNVRNNNNNNNSQTVTVVEVVSVLLVL